METPQSIFASSRSRKCSGFVRAKWTRLGWQRMTTLELGATWLSTSPSHSRCACALSESQVISIRELRRNDQRSREERMRQQRHDAEGVDARRDERTAGREKVGGRAGRRRDADAVGRDARRRPVVDAQPEGNDARDLALAHDDVVEREETPLAVLGLERGALVDEEPALDERGQIVEPRIVFVELGQESPSGPC